jgi:hypothetical protein
MKNSFGYLSKRPKHSLIPTALFVSATALTAAVPSSCVAIVPGHREVEADDRIFQLPDQQRFNVRRVRENQRTFAAKST